MAKEISAKVRLLIPGGQATPAPPVGPALGQHGVNIGDFVKKANDATKDMKGLSVGILLTIYKDRTFDMMIKGSPVSVLLKQAAGIESGSGIPNRNKVGKVTTEQVKTIAEKKLKLMNASNLSNAIKMVEGTARSMGIEIIQK
jgi:large subunit ribosomal protein L11